MLVFVTDQASVADVMKLENASIVLISTCSKAFRVVKLVLGDAVMSWLALPRLETKEDR